MRSAAATDPFYVQRCRRCPVGQPSQPFGLERKTIDHLSGGVRDFQPPVEIAFDAAVHAVEDLAGGLRAFLSDLFQIVEVQRIGLVVLDAVCKNAKVKERPG
jgi:hypothetical protein